MEAEEGLTINKAYAARYTKRKQAEELSKLQSEYGDGEESDSSTSEEEDDEAEALTTQIEQDFLRTLSLIKAKDPRIYDSTAKLYSAEPAAVDSGSEQKSKEKPAKPMYLKDYERKKLLEKGSMADVSESEDEEKVSVPPTYSEEQHNLKESFKRAATEVGAEDSEVLAVRKKTKEEEEEEERAYALWLKGQKAKLDKQCAKELKTLRKYWTDPSLDQGEVFLRDYILNKGYLEHKSKRVPSYNEVIQDSSNDDNGDGRHGDEDVGGHHGDADAGGRHGDEDAGGRHGDEDAGGDSVDESEDEEAIDEQEEFERKFNFRFEEPDGSLITSYPRTIAGSVRRVDNTRTLKRKERDEKKAEEKARKKEELKRLKNLKRQEIMDKLEKLKKITGNPDIGFKEEDLEGEFDPEKFDKAMQSAFNDEFYGVEEDTEKPVFSDSEGGEDWDTWTPGDEEQGDEPHCEDPNFNMDAEYTPSVNEVESNRAKKKKRKNASKFKKAVEEKKPVFDPQEKTFEQYFDEYYKLDYEDIVGGMPCRFKYRSVVPNDFGLTTEEILAADDKELNKWVSLKKAVQYRTEDEEKRDIRKYRKRARDEGRKHRILASLEEKMKDTRPQAEMEEGRPSKKAKKADTPVDKAHPKKKAKHKTKTEVVSDSRLASYGIKKRK